MRKIALIALSLVVLLTGLVLALPSLLNTTQLRAQVEAELQRGLGRKVTFKDLDLGFLPPRVSLTEVAVAEGVGFPQQPFARTREFALRVALVPLFSGNVDVQSIEAKQPAIELIRNPDGVWNYASLGGAQSAGDGDTLKVGLVRITSGTVAITDHLNKRPPGRVPQH
ncbi:MAG: AsmA family protein [Acidobacteria bacterium]|nr:AsmA family protein [Acidobacteriota bacterium]